MYELPVLFVAILQFIRYVNTERLGDVHTSAAQISQLVEMESKVVKTLNKYLEMEEERHNIIKKYIDEWQHLNPESYVINPLNSYHFLLRLSTQYANVDRALSSTQRNEVVNEINGLRSRVKIPDKSDVNGVAWALVRLQYTYNLTIDDLIEGTLAGASAIKGLTADDCLRFAQQSFQNLEFDLSETWTNKAVELLENERPLSPQTFSRIKNLKQEAENKKMMRGMVTRLAKQENKLVVKRFSGLGIPSSFQQEIHTNPDENIHINTIETNYQRLCRGDNLQPLSSLSALTCSYVLGDSVYRLLMPFKVELIWPDPIAAIFHDVLSDRESQLLMDLAFPKLEITQVHAFVSHNRMKSLARVAKAAWIKPDNNADIDRILKRVEHATGLSAKYAEDFHILNYGIGGHYDVHVDHFDLMKKNMTTTDHKGDRMATVLFYLNDVDAGGATVFPYLKIAVSPQRGSVLFWFNLKRNGFGDDRTLHAACPVLLGQKWIANLWIHEYGNEFRWPCNTDSFE